MHRQHLRTHSGPRSRRAGRSRDSAPAPDAAVDPELLTTQVAGVTSRCTSMRALREQLVGGRRRLGVAAAAHHVRLISCATPVLAAEAPAGSAGERFRCIADKCTGVVADYQACGCHAHVGVPGRETAVANHLRPWLPTLLALSGNSPLHHGQETGHVS
ncbi:glutamate-cysteine ligase family protein [Salinifilum ghardaiensis]